MNHKRFFEYLFNAVDMYMLEHYTTETAYENQMIEAFTGIEDMLKAKYAKLWSETVNRKLIDFGRVVMDSVKPEDIS